MDLVTSILCFIKYLKLIDHVLKMVLIGWDGMTLDMENIF